VFLLFLNVPEEGLEPSCLATNDFESFAYTIPPLRLPAILLQNALLLKHPRHRVKTVVSYHPMKLTAARKALILVGPTASGKSALAVKLAKRFNGEIVSADSRQVYKGLDIGTGKITKREMQGVPHYLLDITSPKKVFNAQDFIDHASEAIEDIRSRGKLPIIVGGTGFYIDALVGRIDLAKVEPDAELRARLDKKTPEQLYEMLQKKSPARARSMATPSERNNKVRLIRALEIASAKGYAQKLPRSDLGRKSEYLWIGIAPGLQVLDNKIQKRLHERLKGGMIREATKLHAAGLSYKRMAELGLEYRSLARYLQKKISRKGLEDELFVAIRRYARKQITYWKRNKDINWFESPTSKEIEQRVQTWSEKHDKNTI
jgi:tRNA dimethylallyltransferase